MQLPVQLLLDELASRVIMPYIVMAIILVLLGLLLKFAHLPEVDTDAEDAASGESNAKKTSIWQFPHLILGVIALFFYVGVEVIAGDSIIRYGQSIGIAMESAKYYTSLTLIKNDNWYTSWELSLFPSISARLLH